MKRYEKFFDDDDDSSLFSPRVKGAKLKKMRDGEKSKEGKKGRTKRDFRKRN